MYSQPGAPERVDSVCNNIMPVDAVAHVSDQSAC
jgi:hypothetical protein